MIPKFDHSKADAFTRYAHHWNACDDCKKRWADASAGLKLDMDTQLHKAENYRAASLEFMFDHDLVCAEGMALYHATVSK